MLTAIGKIRPKIINAAGKYGPIAWRPLNYVLIGNNPAHRVQRGSISIAVIATLLAAIILASSGVQIFATGVGSNMSVTGATYLVTATPHTIKEGQSVNLTASVSHFIPKVTLTVEICVTEPNGHGTYCDTTHISTNSKGAGSVTLLFPKNFSHASTEYPGTYKVRATFSYVYGVVGHASTTFKVTS